jgi:hypothetical protein
MINVSAIKAGMELLVKKLPVRMIAQIMGYA